MFPSLKFFGIILEGLALIIIKKKKVVEFAREDSWPWKEIENLNRPIMSKEIESIIRNLPERKSQDQMASLMNFTSHFKKN